MLQIRIADSSDYERVREFYYSLIDAMEDAEYKPGVGKRCIPDTGTSDQKNGFVK